MHKRFVPDLIIIFPQRFTEINCACIFQVDVVITHFPKLIVCETVLPFWMILVNVCTSE